MKDTSPVRSSDAAVSGFVERSVSATTRESYRRTVREFARFLGKSVVDASPDDVRRWRDDLAARGQRPATIARKLSTARSMFAYLEAGGFGAPKPPPPQPLPPPPPRSERNGPAP